VNGPFPNNSSKLWRTHQHDPAARALIKARRRERWLSDFLKCRSSFVMGTSWEPALAEYPAHHFFDFIVNAQFARDTCSRPTLCFS
jgi:hypothetical protein